MIYHNMAPAMLDLREDGVIPPLTKCDPMRRKYTAGMLAQISDSVFTDWYFVRKAQRGVEERREERDEAAPGSLTRQWAEEQLAQAGELLESALEGYSYSLGEYERARSGAYIV